MTPFIRHYRIGMLLLLLLGFSTTGCIEITERITFNRDGKSGTMSVSYDMSNMRSMLAMIAAADTTGENNDPAAGMASAFEEDSDKLMKVAGISDVTYRSDTDELLFTIDFKFEDIEALNRAIHTLYDTKTDDRGFTQKGRWLAFEPGETIEEEKTAEEEAGEEGEEGDMDSMFDPDDLEDNPMAQSMFEDLLFRQYVTFEGKEVKKVKGSEYASFDYNTAYLEVPMLEMLKDDKLLRYKAKVK